MHRKQGGQKGHKRHQRELVPTEDCTTVTPRYPNACRRCGGELQADDSPPVRHQVWELPEIKPIIDEDQLHRGHESLVALIGNYQGIILNCDRAKMYLDGTRLQWCWAHLKRDFQS